MPDVFEYIQYRDFLKDFYMEKKKANPSFSYQVMANQAGFASKSFLPHVIEGKKNVSEKSLSRLLKALSLKPKQEEYFRLLVSFNQAKKMEQQKYFLGQLIQFQQSNKVKMILRERYELFANWYNAAILEMISKGAFDGDLKKLAKTLVPAITVKQARDSLAVLLRLGLIIKKDERFEAANTSLSTGDALHSVAVADFHRQSMAIASEAIKNCDAKHRDISCIVGSISEDTYEIVKNEISLFRKRLCSIIDREKTGDDVYFINFHLFPVTRKYDERSSK